MTDVTYTVTSRGSRMLIHENHMYTKDRSYADGSETWRCHDRSCRGRVRLADEAIRVVATHVHVADLRKVLAQKFQVELKRRAADTMEPPRQIIQAAYSGIAIEAPPAIPGYDARRKTVHRQRRKMGIPTVNPNTLAEIDLPDELLKSIRGEDFFYTDTGPEDKSRILVFTTEKNARILNECDVWYGDGTFDVAPKLFKQLYSIHGEHRKKVVPLLYGVLPDKDGSTYKKFFEEVREAIVVARPEATKPVGPKTFVVDFEQAVIKSFKKPFPNSDMAGCMFHLGQNVWRQIQAGGNAKKYECDLEFQILCKMVMAVAYFPLDDVLAGWMELTQYVEGLSAPLDDPLKAYVLPLLEYFEGTYVRRFGRNGAVKPPLYPPRFWNAHGRATEGGSRTTNAVEAWNKAFTVTVGVHHPSVGALVHALRKEQDMQEVTMEQLATGMPAPKNQKSTTAKAIERLVAVVASYDHEKKLDYLRRIAANLEMNV